MLLSERILEMIFLVKIQILIMFNDDLLLTYIKASARKITVGEINASQILLKFCCFAVVAMGI